MQSKALVRVSTDCSKQMQALRPRYDDQVIAEELLTFDSLVRFHRELVAPDFKRIFSRLDRVDGRFDDVLSHFDAIYKRFDRLESEYQTLRARTEPTTTLSRIRGRG